MSDSSGRDNMSSTHSSPGSTGEPEEPRKKGARGGKRSVTHLSKAQLARKRANDREAQRNIRQRTKEHIENLEQKVKELESGDRSSSMERVLKRNRELEEEIELLKLQVAQTPITPTQIQQSESADGMLASQKLEWMPDTDAPPGWTTTMASHVPTTITSRAPTTTTTSSGYTTSSNSQLYPPVSNAYEESEDSQHLYTPTAIPIWNDPMIFGQTPQTMVKPVTPVYKPFHPALSQPSIFASLEPSELSQVINQARPQPPHPSFDTAWQAQPSIYAWQISTRLKAPVTIVDQLMFSVIHSQRQLHAAGASGDEAIGPEFPSVHLLFNQPGPSKPPATLTEVMARYSAVLSNRGFQLIPEKLASFMCMYRFVQWQILPNYQTYRALHEWQAPKPAQLLIAHPAWMDLPPWPAFREKVIENQERYSNSEFQNDYATNLSVNWKYDPMQALIFEDGQIKISKMMDRHLSDLANMSMKKAFADKYPEFRDVCRFDEV